MPAGNSKEKNNIHLTVYSKPGKKTDDVAESGIPVENIEEVEELTALDEDLEEIEVLDDDTEEIEVLYQDIDEIKEIEVLDEGNYEENLQGSPVTTGLYFDALFNSGKQRFEKAGVPTLLLTSNLKIHWVNKAALHFIATEEKIINQYIHYIFPTYLNEERMADIYKSILSPDKGFSWKGKVELSGRHRITATANMFIFPYFNYCSDSPKPEGYVAYIDDLTDEKNNLIQNTFNSLLKASLLKDNDTGNHIERVNQFSQKITKALYNKPGYEEVDMDFVVNISYLAAMHDVGKIGTPDDILNKPGSLTDTEWDIMKQHTINGALILNSYPNKMASDIARSHHEKWDGSGYPYNLSGKYIPLSARIVAIADVYDALRMKRSYKEGFSHEKAFSIILEGKGKHFDPDLIDVAAEIEKDLDTLFTNLSDKEDAE